MSLAFGFALPHWQAISGGAFSPASLFAGGTVAGAWYDPSDLSTMFTTSAGTTPVAMPGQGSAVSVGAMLDKRATGYSNYFDGTGDYLSFASDSGLALGAGQYTVELWVYLTASVNFGVFFSVTGGLQFSTNASNNVAVALQGVAFQLESTTPVTLNQWAHLAVTRDSGNTTRIFLNGSQIASAVITTNYGQGVSYANFNAGLPGTHHTGYYANLRVVKGAAVYTGNFTPPTAPLSPITGTSLLTCGVTWSGNPTITKNGDVRIDGLNPFTASPVGNHAIAFNDTTARPELRARVNLLTWSENWADPAWSNSGMTVAATGVSDPFGGNSAFTIRATVTNSGNQSFQSNNTVPVGTSILYSLWVRRRSGTGTVRVKNPDGVNFTDITSVLTPSWQRFTLTSVPNPNGFFYPGLTVETLNDEVDVYGVDLRPANIGANVPAYQRIADANTYDTSGFPLYLFFDGIDDSMYTPAGIGIFGNAEFVYWLGINRQTTAASNAVFGWGSSSGAGQACGQYRVSSVESVQYAGGSPFNFASGPDFRPNVFSYSKTPGAINTTSSARLNGLPNNGTGNSSTVPNIANSSLKIGQWADFPSDFFNGHLYSLIIAGSAVSAGNISATEQWVAQRTGIVIP